MFPFSWFSEGTAGPYLLTVLIISTIWCFIVGMITRNYSQVDKLWSLLPPIYCLIVVLSTTSIEPLLIIMNMLIWMWGIRLTYNFSRRDGYTWSGEDYRWPELRRIIKNRFLFELFNLIFISIFQNLLLLFIASPIYYIQIHRTSSINLWDIICILLFLVFFIIEIIADEQQWNFHIDKKDGKQYTRNGFLQTGLFSYIRHPNYFSEICIWWIFYAFTYGVRPVSFINWTILGPISLTLLINGSTSFTETISSRKYSKYKQYQQTIPRLLPWWPIKKRD